MSITSDFQDIVEQYTQEAAALEARKILRNIYNDTVQGNETIQAIADAGKFNLIPASVKNALNDWWTLIKDHLALIEADADIMEIKDAPLFSSTSSSSSSSLSSSRSSSSSSST